LKNAVVTGGGSGIGQAVAHRLRADGMTVAILDLNPSDAEHSYVADVTDRAQVDVALNAIRAKLGPVTVLVNAAGLEKFKRFTDISFEEWQRVVDVNLHGVFHCIQAVLPDMIEAGWGRIVTISSSSAQSGAPHMAHYAASKGGVVGLTRALAVELARQGITVNTVPPTMVDTPMARHATETGDFPGIDVVAPMIPLGRAGTPADIAGACSYLCGPDGDYITGQMINVNGGMYI
jgi:2-hydroxycyclohexanecarboxyl-CoA dehydrogenase